MKFDEDDPMRIAFEELSARQADLEMRRIGIKM
jgi:DNA-directed RNA polymerase subunit K/omega